MQVYGFVEANFIKTAELFVNSIDIKMLAKLFDESCIKTIHESLESELFCPDQKFQIHESLKIEKCIHRFR